MINIFNDLNDCYYFRLMRLTKNMLYCTWCLYILCHDWARFTACEVLAFYRLRYSGYSLEVFVFVFCFLFWSAIQNPRVRKVKNVKRLMLCMHCSHTPLRNTHLAIQEHHLQTVGCFATHYQLSIFISPHLTANMVANGSPT